jgi:predicted transcriptional regulator
VWSRRGSDYDTFRLLVRMKGGKARVNLLRALNEQKNKFQLAKELNMNWKAVDRHIKYGLIKESESTGKIKYYTLTPYGKKILELLDELNSIDQELKDSILDSQRILEKHIDNANNYILDTLASTKHAQQKLPFLRDRRRFQK